MEWFRKIICLKEVLAMLPAWFVKRKSEKHVQLPQLWEVPWRIFSNYWMRLSRIWRILQVEESVIHRGRRPRWITPFEICRILHILRKPNSIIALLFIQNIFFAQTCKLYSRPFLSLFNDTTLCPGFLGQWFNNLWRQWFNNLQRAVLLTSFWRQWFNNLQRTALLTSLVQYRARN